MTVRDPASLADNLRDQRRKDSEMSMTQGGSEMGTSQDAGDATSVAGSAIIEGFEGGKLGLDLTSTLPESLNAVLRLMEANVMANNYLEKHVEYRNLPNVSGNMKATDEQPATLADKIEEDDG